MLECRRRQHEDLRGMKGQLEEEPAYQGEISVPSGEARLALLREVATQVNILNSTFSWLEADRAAAKRATHVLAELAKNDEVVDICVEGGAVPALVKHLQAPPFDEDWRKPFEHEVEKGSAFALGLLPVEQLVPSSFWSI